MIEIPVKSSLPFTFTSYKDAENFAGFVESMKGCVESIVETVSILDDIEECDYEIPEEISDKWDLTIVHYYSELTREIRVFAVETLRNYVETEIHLRKKMKSKKK